MLLPYALLERQHAALDLRCLELVDELEVEGRYDLLRRQMDGEDVAGALGAGLAAGEVGDRLDDTVAGPLADQQALALARHQDRRDRQHHADQHRGDAVELGDAGPVGEEDAGRGDGDADQRRAVLEQHHEGRRILAVAHRPPVGARALALAE